MDNPIHERQKGVSQILLRIVDKMNNQEKRCIEKDPQWKEINVHEIFDIYGP